MARKFVDPKKARAATPMGEREDRACADAEPEIFFPIHRVGYRKAIAVCHTCPGRDECLDWALETRQAFGVWGGTTPEQRSVMLAG